MDSSRPTHVMHLDPGFDYDDIVMEMTETIIASIPLGTIVQTEQMFDPADWDYFDPGDHKAIGRAVSRLVKAGKLPFVCEGRSSDNHKLYRKI